MQIPNSLTEADLKTYLIPKGSNRAANPYPCKKYKAEEISSVELLIRMPDPESLFDYKWVDEDGKERIDQDHLDWSKLYGFHLNRWFFQNDKDTILLGFRQKSFENQEWQITPYFNRRDAPNGRLLDKDCIHTFKTGELAHAYFKRVAPRSKVWHCFVGNPGGFHEETILVSGVVGYGRRDKMRTMRGPWYGGADNSPGPFGDKAPTNMTVQFREKVSKYNYT
jgi:hypothetical protein